MARTYATRANQKMVTSMERLSSGKRINSAADDAAGLAVANKMESQQRGIQMAIRNSKDGQSLVRTAEGGMREISNMMLRMRELAVQMDNGVYTSKDRDNAQLEINALLAEIDKIADNTRFNDVKLLDGSYDQTIRSGNTNSETTRIRLNSMFVKDNGSGSGANPLIYRTFDAGPAATTAADFTTDLANSISNNLGLSATSFSALQATDSEAVLSNVVSSDAFRDYGDNILLLKDNIDSLGYNYAAVKITDSQWEEVSSNLLLTKGLYNELAALDPLDTDQYMEKVGGIRSNLAALEIERSEYIGSLFHANEIDIESVRVDGLTNNKYAEVVNAYSDPSSRGSVASQITAIEVDFQAVATTLHNPTICPHCIALSVSGGSGGTGGSTLVGGEGVSANGSEFAAADASVTAAGSPSASNVSGSAPVSALIKGTKWTGIGDDLSAAGGANNLSYSYWNGTTTFNYTQGTRTTLDSHATGTNNQVAHDAIFQEWDKVAPFSLDKIVESSDAAPVGDLRVSVTDTMPGGAAAFAYYPNSNANGGDIYYGDTQVMGNATDTDFVEGGYNWSTALHEIGHALGLSHPFSGSGDGSVLNLNLDGERNTVMSYVQRDRNQLLTMTGGAGTNGLVFASTPGLLDIEAIEHLYGSTNWTNEVGNTTYGAGTGSDLFDDSYESIRTITDSGGTDTLSAAGVIGGAGNIINLTPGTYSSINFYATDAEKFAALSSNAGDQSFFAGVIAARDALASAANATYQAFTRSSLYRGQDNVGIAHNTWIENAIGGSGADTITGNNLGNEITGGGGDDTIDGSGGVDVAIYTGNFATYGVTQSGATVTVAGGADATDSLTNIEFLKFDDGVWSIADAVAGAAAATHANIAAAGITGTETGGLTGGVTSGDGALNVSGMTLTEIKLETTEGAQAAVLILDKSLEQISEGRAKLGAVSNRLAHNLDNQTKASMMSQQAMGRVVDTEMAIESTKLAQEMILSQAAQQAINMSTQRQLTVLELLKS